jgi:hypothetical protein
MRNSIGAGRRYVRPPPLSAALYGQSAARQQRIGPYIGGNLGYGWGDVSNSGAKPSGVLGGLQVGYNWQNGAWVAGIEGDLQLNAADDTFAPWKFSNPWFGTVRGRIGYAFNNVLLYGTGGLAFGSLKVERAGGFSESTTSAGWTMGAGGIRDQPELVGSRISVCRSQRQKLHAHRDVEWLLVQHGSSRRELSLLIGARLRVIDPGPRARDFHCGPADPTPARAK